MLFFVEGLPILGTRLGLILKKPVKIQLVADIYEKFREKRQSDKTKWRHVFGFPYRDKARWKRKAHGAILFYTHTTMLRLRGFVEIPCFHDDHFRVVKVFFYRCVHIGDRIVVEKEKIFAAERFDLVEGLGVFGAVE